jgi:hypothetical protein
VDVEAWLAGQGERSTAWEVLLRRLYAEHGPLGPPELAIAVDLERIRLVSAAVERVTAGLPATVDEPLSCDEHHQDEGSIGVLYQSGATRG